ncbi:MAG: class I SAM-dependent methyltransferase [Candidatus Omnitrophica bacterium]|nr:class I SAM-dependent methyltransferase [Candidatus Omnitrophota bacterium]
MHAGPDSCPEFMAMVELVSAGNPLQKKRIQHFIGTQDAGYWTFAEHVCRTINRSFLRTPGERAAAAASYNRMTMDFLREQIRFRKTGVYPVTDAGAAQQSVYNRPDVMRYYMVGLFLSYLFWPNHYAMFCFFRDYLSDLPGLDAYLEIAPGHGLFAAETLRRFPAVQAALLDISPTSIKVTGEILQSFGAASDRVCYINGDFLTTPIDRGGFDFVCMGEVLEHVNDAPAFLRRAGSLLLPGGRIFMSTCTNSPAIDHVYFFRNISEIRALVRSAGLEIVKEKVLPAEPVSEECCEQERVTVNYCAILKKSGGLL